MVTQQYYVIQLGQPADITFANHFGLSIITAQDASDCSPRALTVPPVPGLIFFSFSSPWVLSLSRLLIRFTIGFPSSPFHPESTPINRPPSILHRRTLLPDRILKNVAPPHRHHHLPSRRDENNPTLKPTCVFSSTFIFSLPLPFPRFAPPKHEKCQGRQHLHCLCIMHPKSKHRNLQRPTF